MKSFRFPLQKVLEFRQNQLEMEEVKFKQHLEEVAALDRARASLEAAGQSAEVQVREWRPVAGRDVGALGGFRSHVQPGSTNWQAGAHSGKRPWRGSRLQCWRPAAAAGCWKGFGRGAAPSGRGRETANWKTWLPNRSSPAGCAASGEGSGT